MKNLKAYVDNKNQWNAIFGMAPMDINNDMDRVQIAQTLDGELSPENLHCDGEISQAQAMRKLRDLNRVCKELIELDPSVKIYEYYP
jgi:hypothetical protein